MSTELEALENIRSNLARHYDFEKIYEWSAIEDDFEIIEKKLKALEIIKRYMKLEGDKVYTVGWEWNLTQEEYELVKEVML